MTRIRILGIVLIVMLNLGGGMSQNVTADIVNGYGDVVGSISADPYVEKEYPCPTKCSPIHYCHITVYVNHTAEVECRPCVKLCEEEYDGDRDTNICEKYCPAVWAILANSTIDSESEIDLQTLVIEQEEKEITFHNVLLPVPDPRNLASTINGAVVAVLSVVVSLLFRKGWSVLEVKMGAIQQEDDEEPIIPPEGLILPTAERLDMASRSPAPYQAEHVQLQEVGGAMGYGATQPQTQGAGHGDENETKY